MQIDTLTAEVSSVNLRAENHGEETVVACDVSLKAESAPVGHLAALLGGDLDDADLSKLIASEKITKLEVGGLELANHRVTLHPSGGDDLFADGPPELRHVKVNKIAAGLAGHETGFVDVSLRIQFRPRSEEICGRLAQLIKETVRVELRPDEEEPELPKDESSEEGAGDG